MSATSHKYFFSSSLYAPSSSKLRAQHSTHRFWFSNVSLLGRGISDKMLWTAEGFWRMLCPTNWSHFSECHLTQHASCLASHFHALSQALRGLGCLLIVECFAQMALLFVKLRRHPLLNHTTFWWYCLSSPACTRQCLTDLDIFF